MDSKTRKSFIKELNDKINEYVEKKNLFCGGCCYAAYLLAGVLEKTGIKYKVVLFEAVNTLTKDFNQSINNGGFGVNHVAIQVRTGLFPSIIGDTSDYKRYHGRKIHRYDDVTPHMLFQAYLGNTWNDLYETSNNSRLRKDIGRIYAKYGCGTAE